MSHPLASLRFPSDRSLIARTKLAYVHLPRLLSDAKRDRSARVSAYVAIWLPEGLVILYLKSGELVNASFDNGRMRQPLSLSDALARIPSEPEWGEVCFNEAPDEQLACMYAAHSLPHIPPDGANGNGEKPDIFLELHRKQFSGLVELILDGHVNYMIFESGKVVRAYLSGASEKPLAERAARSLSDPGAVSQLVKLFPLSKELPQQAVPALIKAYRELMDSLIRELVNGGRSSAPAIAEHARRKLVAGHPTLNGFAQEHDKQFDPVCTAQDLSRDVAAWVQETIWAGMDIEHGAPQDLFRDLTRERRHMFQSAGFFEHIPWKLEW